MSIKTFASSTKIPLQFFEYTLAIISLLQVIILCTMAGTRVVVGASKGIGLELVKQLLDEGKSVIIGAKDPSVLQIYCNFSKHVQNAVPSTDAT